MKVNPVGRLEGTVILPGDKSISHRYAMLGAMARGATRIKNYSPSLDCHSTLACLQELGVKIEQEPGSVTILSDGPGGWTAPVQPLDVGNSGTTIRLMSGMLSSQPFPSTLTGDPSVQQRPMKRIVDPLRKMGGLVRARKGRFPPLQVGGHPLTGIDYSTPLPSAQVKSCILLAGLQASGGTRVSEPLQSRDHTERALPHFGVETEIAHNRVSIAGQQILNATEIAIPGDFSAAIYFILPALLKPGSELTIPHVGLNPTRCKLLDVLQKSGAAIEVRSRHEHNSEPCAELFVAADTDFANNFPATLPESDVPAFIDEIPLLAVLATQLPEGLLVRGAADLRNKESDRIASVVSNFNDLGLKIEEFDDGFYVPGRQVLTGGRVRSYSDHRIAMAFSVAGLFSRQGVEIDEPACCDVSDPEFFTRLEALAR